MPAVFWGMFPDIFSFVIPYIIFFFILIFAKGFNISAIYTGIQSPAYSGIIEILYNISHSLVIFSLVFLLAWLIFRKPIWIMLGWLLHILIDIPTHIKGYFATPMFWPISNFKINGIAYWREPVVMIIDIILLIIAYSIIYIVEYRLKKRKKEK